MADRMKKQLAWIVAMGMVLSAGCAQKASDTGTSETSETTASSEKTSETTSEVTSGSTAEPTSDTSEAADTSHSLVKHDLEYLPLRITTMDERFFAKPVERVLHDEFDDDTTYEVTLYPKMLLYAEQMVFDSPEYSDLQKKVEEILAPGLEKLKKEHADLVKSFKDGNDPYPNMEYAFFQTSQNIELFRADSQILSFRVNTESAMPSEYSSEYAFGLYSFNAKTAEPILLDDVVKDKEALMKLVDEGMDNNLRSVFFSADDPLKEIKDGSIRFALTYDGICLFPSVENRGSIVVKVSAFAHPDLFDLNYFGHTPENYSLFTFALQTDPEEKAAIPDMDWELDRGLYWDFNEDGKLDVLNATYGASSGQLMLMDTPHAFNNAYSFLTFVQTKDGQYLFADSSTYEGESFAVQSDGHLQEISQEHLFYPANRYMIDPERFENEVAPIYLSTAFFLKRGAGISEGKVVQSDTVVRYGGGDRLKIDVQAKKYDVATGTIGEDIVLKKDSYLVMDLFYEEEEQSKIVCRVYEMDSEEFTYAVLLSDDGLFSISGDGYSDMMDLFS